MDADAAFMRAALALAGRNLGTTWPNPSVGCVIVRDGRVIGRGATQPGGRPHAETVALARAGDQARGGTAYVTLEPCCHVGQTPPCTDALIQAGIARVVIGARDPDPRVNGQGVASLRAAGIEMREGVLAEAAAESIAGFAMRLRNGRPLVTLKLASTLDGRIATRTGESRWITGEPARRMAHALRGRHDAVMVGIGTVLADDPELTCRLPGFRAIPNVRIVVDSALRIPRSARLLTTAGEASTWVVVGDGVDKARLVEIERSGARVFVVPPRPHPNPLPQAGEGAVCASPARFLPSPSPPEGGEGWGEGGGAADRAGAPSPPEGGEGWGEGRGAADRSGAPSPPEGGEGWGEGDGRELDLQAALTALGAAGLTSILVEGGARLAASLLRAGLVDRLAWFHAPALMGGDGLAAVQSLGIDRLAELPRFRRGSAISLGDDMLTMFERVP